MAIIIKGDNHGIAVDGDLKIENMEFTFGQGVKSVSGVHKLTEEVEEAQAEEIKDEEITYPEITQEQVDFFVPTFNRGAKDASLPNAKIVEEILHLIYEMTRTWDTAIETSARKWRILYEFLSNRKWLKIKDRPRYKKFVKCIVAYCFPNVQEGYGNNISKIDLTNNGDDWGQKERNFYTKIANAFDQLTSSK